MDPISYRPEPRVASRLPMLLGVLIAIALLWYLPSYLEQVEYSKTLGQVRAVNEVLPEIGPKLESLSKAFSVIAAKVGPSVVFIDTKQTRVANTIVGAALYNLAGQASGVIVDPDGYIVTNNHVVDNASEIRVKLSDNRQFTAEVIGTDPASDLAVIKIAATKLVAAEWGDSGQLEVGEWVLAIGNPYGFDNTVTFGIVSAKNRRGFENSPTQDFLQTDAAVNPGNSGGPLVNMQGRVVGINTAIYGPSYQGISFSLPSSTAKEVYERLKKGQPIAHAYGYLGAYLGRLSPANARRLGIKSDLGVLVNKVVAGSPADQAGLKAGDVIVAWDGQPADDPALLRLVVARSKAGSTVTVTVIRQGEEIQLDVTIGQGAR
jgi:serine protease Do